MKNLCCAFLLALFVFPSAQDVAAQEIQAPIIKAIVPEYHMMFKKTVWRRLDLQERQNRAFSAINQEIPRLLFEAVEEGLIKPYMSDSCVNLMPDSIFIDNTSIERQAGGFGGGGFDSGFGGGFGDEPAQEAEEPEYDKIPPEVFDILYLKEDLIFDRNRSRMYWYIQSVSVAIPADAGATWNEAGFEKKVAHFKYEDVINLFRGPYADRALWYNNQNDAAHRNYGDALELRLFSAPIVKVSNAQDLDIRQMTSDPYEAVMLQQKHEYDLMEYESELWEY